MKHFILRIWFILFFAIFFFSSPKLKAQPTTGQKLYHTFIAGRMDQWGEIISTHELNNPVQTVAEKLELIGYCYGYVGYLLGVKRLKDAEVYMDKGLKLSEEIIETHPDVAEAYAYKGAFLGFRISTDHSIAFILGPISAFYIRKGYRINPNQVQAIIDMANFYFYAPGFFGGDVFKAIPLYAKAAKTMEECGQSKENWLYFNLMILLAKANDKAQNYTEAEKIYSKILKIEPEFGWVKNKLLPDLKRKMVK